MEYGWMLLRMIAVLAAVCALAYVFLRWGVKRLVSFNPDRVGRLQIVERLGVAPKRSILVVRAGEEFLLVGSSEAGLQMLGNLEPEGWEDLGEPEDDALSEKEVLDEASEEVPEEALGTV